MTLFERLSTDCLYLNRYQLIEESSYSRSQLYQWLKEGARERKVRECQKVSAEVVRATVETILKYPHFGPSKGQGYMTYHQTGYVPQHTYKELKKKVKRVVFQEVNKRKLLPARTSYEHERPDKPGEIWAEDFTTLTVCGKKFYAALLIDVAASYYLGGTASLRADTKMVEVPVQQALTFNGGQGPKRFLLSDNGSQYVSTKHGRLLNKLSIIQKRIPSCMPQYNGSVECGVKEFKNVFYNVWAKIDESDLAMLDENELLECVQLVLNETIRRQNDEIPRPSLKGVTPADVMKAIAEEKRERNRLYLEREQANKEVKQPWNKKDWGWLKKQLFADPISNLELMTKFCFFLKRPLRKLANLEMRVLGN